MKTKRIIVITISILLIIIAIVGTTYAYFIATVSGNENATSVIVQTGGLSLTYTNGQEITGEDILPGWSETKTFTVENTGTEEISFYINLVEVTNTFVNRNDLVYELAYSDDTVIKSETALPKRNGSLTQISQIEAGEELTFKLTIRYKDTVNNQGSDMGKEFMGKIEISTEEIIQRTQLIVDGEMYLEYDINMIPVAYTSSGATVKADITNTDSTYKWYDYNAKRWANAVLVWDDNRETYKNAIPGTPIIESDILAYLVYIPRYRYELFNAENGAVPVQTINVEIENEYTTKSTGSTNGAWLTHPAFTFGETELNGIWVGKFETSPDETSTCYTNSNTTNCNITTITPRVKPNKSSWSYINVSNIFTTSQYFKANSIYGITESEIDAHMMKNMEWGAVAYLTQSNYGKNGEIYANNYKSSNNSLTGCSSGSTNVSQNQTSCTYPYPSVSTAATGASTTGTIYGIYDMSGGSDEYVMGNMVDSSGVFYPSSSGFELEWGESNSKYYDSYAYSTALSNHSRGKLGDATKEILTCKNDYNCGWNSDDSHFPYSWLAWFIRGGGHGSAANAGVFAFNRDDGQGGNVNFKYSSRVVLAIESTE